MKKITVIIAILLAALLIFAACKPAQEAAEPSSEATEQPSETPVEQTEADADVVIASIKDEAGNTREILL